MDENLKTLNLKILENTAAALRANRFEAAVYETVPAAAAALLALAHLQCRNPALEKALRRRYTCCPDK